jgi:hypothetical protein
MAEVQSDAIHDRAAFEPSTALKRLGAAIRSSNFKYYIHDSVAAYRLQLLGELSEVEVTELEGCWQTAKTTLGGRRLILDLRGVKTLDEAGKRWLAGMAQEGATYAPETFLRDALAGRPPAGESDEPSGIPLSLLGRVLGLFRGARVAAAE